MQGEINTDIANVYGIVCLGIVNDIYIVPVNISYDKVSIIRMQLVCDFFWVRSC